MPANYRFQSAAKQLPQFQLFHVNLGGSFNKFNATADPLLDAVVQAETAVHALNVQLHYLSCGDVVGRQRKPSEAGGN